MNLTAESLLIYWIKIISSINNTTDVAYISTGAIVGNTSIIFYWTLLSGPRLNVTHGVLLYDLIIKAIIYHIMINYIENI